jgi:hypothetical protein
LMRRNGGSAGNRLTRIAKPENQDGTITRSRSHDFKVVDAMLEDVGKTDCSTWQCADPTLVLA